jgi:hypothetical protein
VCLSSGFIQPSPIHPTFPHHLEANSGVKVVMVANEWPKTPKKSMELKKFISLLIEKAKKLPKKVNEKRENYLLYYGKISSEYLC